MKSWVVRVLIFTLSMLLISNVSAEEESNVDKARDALAKQTDDEDSARQLEEVFQSAEKSYSLMKSGGKSLSYSLDYSYTSDARIDLEVVNNTIRNTGS